MTVQPFSNHDLNSNERYRIPKSREKLWPFPLHDQCNLVIESCTEIGKDGMTTSWRSRPTRYRVSLRISNGENKTYLTIGKNVINAGTIYPGVIRREITQYDKTCYQEVHLCTYSLSHKSVATISS